MTAWEMLQERMSFVDKAVGWQILQHAYIYLELGIESLKEERKLYGRPALLVQFPNFKQKQI
jgi:hypothetical protein